MNSLDLLIIVVVLALAGIGYAQGFIVGAASLFGLALGGLVGTRLTHALIEQAAEGTTAATWAPLIGLCAGLLVTLIGAMAMQDLGAELRQRLQTHESAAVDRLLGAGLLAVVGLLLAWFAAASVIGVASLRPVRAQIVESRVVQQLNATLPDAGPLLGVIASYDPFPRFDGGEISIGAPDRQLPRDVEVRRAARSVVRVVGSACGYQVTGTGWVAARGYVVTNAHVVGGQQDTGVQPDGSGEPLDADVVAFDRVNDLAVLRVDDLDLPVLRQRTDAPRGEAAVVLGYPENQGFRATAARYSDERVVEGEDVYGRGSYERRVTSFRGLVRHGNSGGPLVDGDGVVLSTVFAATVGDAISGGYGIPNDLALEAVEAGQGVPVDRAVDTGPCIG